jgi:hypothetical protein
MTSNINHTKGTQEATRHKTTPHALEKTETIYNFESKKYIIAAAAAIHLFKTNQKTVSEDIYNCRNHCNLKTMYNSEDNFFIQFI